VNPASPPHKSGPRISIAREIAFRVLKTVRRGSYAEVALFKEFVHSELSPEDRGLATELVYGTLRWRNRLDFLINKCLNRPGKRLKEDVREILRIALYQIVFLDRIPDHAAVDQAVSQVCDHCGDHSAAFVNAILRNFLRNQAVLDSPPSNDDADLAIHFSHPEFLVKSWVDRFGSESARKILRFNNTPAPLEIRVNTLRTSAEALRLDLANQFVTMNSVQGLPGCFRISGLKTPLSNLAAHSKGLFAIQSSVSQMISHLLKPESRQRILDTCAAPGGKISHIAALTGNESSLVAMDVNPVRLKEMEANLHRLGAKAKIMLGSAQDRTFMQSLGQFDRVLVDAPCSNLGVLRHNPEIKYRIAQEQIIDHGKVQGEILLGSAEAVRPGGLLLYCVCTVTEEETVQVVDEFLQKARSFEVVPANPDEVTDRNFITERGFFSTFPPQENRPVDGFFAARFRRIG
jgi:16S rRNA (cytosine967-C5)-methyltransferase